jgi:Right handed beta helix region
MNSTFIRVPFALAWTALVSPHLPSESGGTTAGAPIRITARGGGASGPMRKSLDGSTQEKFDSMMSKIRPGAYIQLGPGVFVTHGVHLKNNWRIQGSGKNTTTIKLADNVLATDGPQYASVLYNFDWEGFYDRIQVSDLTLDCNRANQPSFTQGHHGGLNALTTAARNATISRVRALGTWANPGEGFPFSVLSSGSNDGSNRIEIDSCESLNPVGRLTAISAFDQTGGRISGFIRNCTVANDPNGVAFGAGGWKNFAVSHNYTRNMGAAIVIDTHDYENVLIQYNHFSATKSYGILYNGRGQYTNIVIEKNFIEMGESALACLITDQATVSTQIRENRLFQNSATAPAFSIGAKTIGTVSNNIIHENVPSDLSKAVHVLLRNNRDPSGDPVEFDGRIVE